MINTIIFEFDNDMVLKAVDENNLNSLINKAIQAFACPKISSCMRNQSCSNEVTKYALRIFVPYEPDKKYIDSYDYKIFSFIEDAKQQKTNFNGFKISKIDYLGFDYKIFITRW